MVNAITSIEYSVFLCFLNNVCNIFLNFVNSLGSYQRELRGFNKNENIPFMKYRLVNAMKSMEYSVFMCFLSELLLVNPLLYFLSRPLAGFQSARCPKIDDVTLSV